MNNATSKEILTLVHYESSNRNGNSNDIDSSIVSNVLKNSNPLYGLQVIVGGINS